jgi:hypothetical protein
MNRKELVNLIKAKIEYDVYKTNLKDIKISEASVLRIIKIIEKNYHSQLFPLKIIEKK